MLLKKKSAVGKWLLRSKENQPFLNIASFKIKFFTAQNNCALVLKSLSCQNETIMRTIKIYCRECEIELTSELTEIPEDDICWEDREDSMPGSNFSIVYEIQSDKKFVLTSIRGHNLKNHSSSAKFSGCCGSSGCNGLNKLCLNGHEVATEISDCWTSHYIKFDNDNVIIKEIKELHL